MDDKLLSIIDSLIELKTKNEAMIFDGDLKAVKSVLDDIGYVYIEKPKGYSHTLLEIR